MLLVMYCIVIAILYVSKRIWFIYASESCSRKQVKHVDQNAVLLFVYFFLLAAMPY